MTIPDGYIIFVGGHPFFLIEMLRPKEDVPGNYIEGRAWYWKLVALDGTTVSYGYVKDHCTCKSSAKRAAKSWLKRNGGYFRQREMMNKTSLNEQEIQAVEAEVKMMLHASRDAMRNRGEDTRKYRFDCRDGYYGEAFGMMRLLATLNFGRLDQATNTPETRENLKWWFSELEKQVLEEENFGGSGVCKHCREKYHKDDATMQEKAS
jgi:hypothetical protein